MLGSILSAGANIVGGLLGRKSSQNFAQQQFFQNAKLMKEFAQHGIRWKVADAKAAGVHPLFALGASTAPASPIGVNMSDPLPNALAQAGQNIGSAIERTRTAAERQEAKLASLAVERSGLENDLLRSQIHALNAKNQVGPPMPDIESHGPGNEWVPQGPYWVAGKGLPSGTPGQGDMVIGEHLPPVSHDSDGNVLIHAGDETLVVPRSWTQAGEVEEILGELGSVPHSVGISAKTYGDYTEKKVDPLIDRLLTYIRKNRTNTRRHPSRRRKPQ